ncbi:sensor histidine kinase [Nocardia tenerifensis]|nr:sensor histidine kinase [Nocardia tenerifensis]
MERRWWIDGAITGVVLFIGFGWALLMPGDSALDPLGVLLLVAGVVPLLIYRIAPLPVLVANMAVAVVYHLAEYPHEALIPATMVALFAVARYGNRRRTLLVIAVVVVIAELGIFYSAEPGENTVFLAIDAIGWVLVAAVAGEAARLQHAYLAAIVDRAERAERTRDEEARRQVTEERLRIARDLHDLLAHTVTVIQVQAGVAAHLLTERKAEPATVIAALDTISDACVDARAELAATVGVLRSPVAESRSPLPTLAQLSALAEPVEAAGASVEIRRTGRVRALAPTVELVGYRIVQEALTNVAKHSGASEARVELDYADDRLGIRVIDNGAVEVGTKDESGVTTEGFGIVGMIERAEAIGGTVVATGTEDGFTVTAELPVVGRGMVEDGSRTEGTSSSRVSPSCATEDGSRTRGTSSPGSSPGCAVEGGDARADAGTDVGRGDFAGAAS